MSHTPLQSNYYMRIMELSAGKADDALVWRFGMRLNRHPNCAAGTPAPASADAASPDLEG